MIVFMHIYKTAGMHFKRYLEAVYRPDELVTDYRDDLGHARAPCNTDPVAWRRETKAFVQQLPPTTKMIFGHFGAAKYFDLFPNIEWMTWVRHPVSRLISNYFYLKTLANVLTEPHILLDAIKSGIDFGEYCEIPVNQNGMTQLFFRFLEPEDFSFIGVQEHFAADLEVLRQRLGWPSLPVIPERTNHTQYPNYADEAGAILADRDLMRRVERLNRADLAFYQRAVELRNQQSRHAA